MENIIETSTLRKIRKLYFSDDTEEVDIAKGWLAQLIGEENAKANLLLLLFWRDWESDDDETYDTDNYYSMSFRTYPTGFGRDYRYTVKVKTIFKGEKIVNDQLSYSRRQVADGDPKCDLMELTWDALEKRGILILRDLFNSNLMLQPV